MCRGSSEDEAFDLAVADQLDRTLVRMNRELKAEYIGLGDNSWEMILSRSLEKVLVRGFISLQCGKPYKKSVFDSLLMPASYAVAFGNLETYCDWLCVDGPTPKERSEFARAEQALADLERLFVPEIKELLEEYRWNWKNLVW